MKKEHRQLGNLAWCLRRDRLTKAQFAVLNSVKLGRLSPNALCEHTAWLSKTIKAWSVSLPAAQVALRVLLARNLVQIINNAAIRKIADGLDALPAIGPLYGLPWLGTVDFTNEGASQYLRIMELVYQWQPGAFAFVVAVPIISHEYDLKVVATNRRLATKTMRRHLALGQPKNAAQTMVVNSPIRKLLWKSKVIPIGKWRDYWWREPADGFQITAKYRKIESNK